MMAGTQSDQKTKLLVIVGPTAVGKTAVSQILAEELNGEIISADSMQVYRRMDVGTAKPSVSEQKKYHYHLLDVVDPLETFSAAEYQRLARHAITEISKRQSLPILVGGSGLYVRAAIDRLDFPAGTVESRSRTDLELELQEKGPDFLYNKLKEVDPVATTNIHPRNVRRVIRALEVMSEEKLKFSTLQQKWSKRESIYDLIMFGLERDRNELYQKIEERVDAMLKRGLIDEVKSLIKIDQRKHLTSTQALGYKEIIAHLDGEISLDRATELIKQRTRRFAKRQLTWFRRDPRVHWIDLNKKTDLQAAEEVVKLLELDRFFDKE